MRLDLFVDDAPERDRCEAWRAAVFDTLAISVERCLAGSGLKARLLTLPSPLSSFYGAFEAACGMSPGELRGTEARERAKGRRHPG